MRTRLATVIALALFICLGQLYEIVMTIRVLKGPLLQIYILQLALTPVALYYVFSRIRRHLKSAEIVDA